MSLALIGLLAPTGVAWAGGLEEFPGDKLCRRENSLMHICQGGEKAGQECTGIHFPGPDGIECVKPDCGGGECVVQYVPKPLTTLPLLVPGTLTFILDDRPLIQSGYVTQTILLEFIQDGRRRFFTNTRLVKDFDEEQFSGNTDLDSVQNVFLFRRVRGAGVNFAKRLNDLFKRELCQGLEGREECELPSNLISVIAGAREPIVRSFHPSDPLGTGLSVPVDIGFAFLRNGATPAADPETSLEELE